MRLVLLPMVLLVLAAADTPDLAVPKRCATPAGQTADVRQPLGVRRLGDMPPGTQIKAVYNEVEGCPKPLVVRQQVGVPRR